MNWINSIIGGQNQDGSEAQSSSNVAVDKTEEQIDIDEVSQFFFYR
jgi:hypothetical protein